MRRPTAGLPPFDHLAEARMILDEELALDAEHFADIHQRLVEYDRLLPHERLAVTTPYMEQFVRDVHWLLTRLGRTT